jgi:hypothetical protein
MKKLLVCILSAAFLAGCAGTPSSRQTVGKPAAEGPRFRSPELSIRLIGALGEEDDGSLVRNPGWLEYLLEIENLGSRPLRVDNVKLLTDQGRYLDSAVEFAQLEQPPSVAEDVAEDIAVRSAGIAASQVIPYGGTIVGIVRGVLTASASDADARAANEFALRRIKSVELAPAGRFSGSAFLPRVEKPRALVVDWGQGAETERIELPLSAAAR